MYMYMYEVQYTYMYFCYTKDMHEVYIQWLTICNLSRINQHKWPLWLDDQYILYISVS